MESVEKPKQIQVFTRAEFETKVFGDEAVPSDHRFRSIEEGGVFEYFWPDNLHLNPTERELIKEGKMDDVYVTALAGDLLVGMA